MSARPCCVVRSPEEAAAALTIIHPAPVFLSTNEKTHAHCLRVAPGSLYLHESVITDEHQRINRWAHNTLIRLIDNHRTQREKAVFLDAHFYNIRILFIRCLKYIRTLHRLVNWEGGVDLYQPMDPTVLLYQTYREYARSINPRLRLHVFPLVIRKNHQPPFSFKNAARLVAGFFGNFIALAQLEKLARRGKRILFASGSLVHLGTVLEKIQQQGDFAVVYGENRFNRDIYRFCRRRGMVYYVLGEPAYIRNPFAHDPLCDAEGDFDYQNENHAPILNMVFRHFHESWFVNRGMDPGRVRRFFERYPIHRMVTDEDFAIRRVFSVTARELGIRCAVISHGVPSVLVLNEGEELANGHYESATTLVNSAFEKEAYRRMMFRPSNLVVTGVPRYDRLFHLKHRPSSKASVGKKKVLYCGTLMKAYDFTSTSIVSNMLGHNIFLEPLRQSLKDLLEVLSKRMDVQLWLKPHFSDEALWQEILQGSDAGKNVRLLSYREDVFEVQAQSDLVVTPPSSVICEALMLDKPVIALNYGNDWMMQPYVKRGVALPVSGKEELARAVGLCLDDSGFLEEYRKIRQQWAEYFFGPWDGRNTQRVTDWILQEKT